MTAPDPSRPAPAPPLRLDEPDALISAALADSLGWLGLTLVEDAGAPGFALPVDGPARLGALLDALRAPGPISCGPLTIDPVERRATIRAEAQNTPCVIALTDSEAGLLASLAAWPDQPVSREALLRDVFAYREGVDTHTLETHVWRLRQKLEEAGVADRVRLETIAGGYCLAVDQGDAG